MRYPRRPDNIARELSVKFAVRTLSVAITLLHTEWFAFARTRSSAPVNSKGNEFREIEFNGDFLPKDVYGKTIDVSHFSRGNPVYPGTYLIRLSLRNVMVRLHLGWR